MGAKRYSTEQIIVKLRQAEIEMGRGVKVPEVCRRLGISEQTFYRWRKRYGGLDRSEVRRLKALEQENARLKKLLAE
ncbi:MAG: transposase, partial [Thermoanaerobaculia bacterium]